MRDIKYRAWIKNAKEMQEVTAIDFFNMSICIHPDYGYIKDKHEFIVMQFTGLKDKNGADIYEGDICKIPDDYDTYGFIAGEVREVYFRDGGFRFKPINFPNSRGHYLEDDHEFEVIGNIHENSELLIK